MRVRIKQAAITKLKGKSTVPEHKHWLRSYSVSTAGIFAQYHEIIITTPRTLWCSSFKGNNQRFRTDTEFAMHHKIKRWQYSDSNSILTTSQPDPMITAACGKDDPETCAFLWLRTHPSAALWKQYLKPRLQIMKQNGFSSCKPRLENSAFNSEHNMTLGEYHQASSD